MSFGKCFLVASVLSACTGLADSSPTGEMVGDVGGSSTEGRGDSSGQGDGTALSVDANYALSNFFSITVASVSPEPAYQLLSDLNNDPGRALVAVADAAGLPAAELLFDALPDSLSGKVAQWMTDAIGSGGIEEVQVLMAWSQLVLAEIEVQSTLSINSFDDAGYADASHTLNNLVFHIDGELVEEEIPQLASLPGAGHADLVVSMRRDDAGLYLFMQQQRFGLLFGEAAYRAFESLIQARYGMDLRGLLGNAIDCDAMATSVAARCVLSMCVGHVSELEALCEGALDSAATRMHDQFSVLDAELLELEAGSARVLWNALGTTLVDGEWQANVELGQGLRSLPARFSGNSF